MHIVPPKSDEVIERHQFYASVSTIVNDVKQHHDASLHRLHSRIDKAASSDSVSRLHDRVDEVSDEVETIESDRKAAEVRNKTLAAVIFILWTGISGIFGWLWDKSSSKIDTYLTKIEVLEKTSVEQKQVIDRLSTEANKVPSLVRTLNQVQEELVSVKTELDKKGRK